MDLTLCDCYVHKNPKCWMLVLCTFPQFIQSLSSEYVKRQQSGLRNRTQGLPGVAWQQASWGHLFQLHQWAGLYSQSSLLEVSWCHQTIPSRCTCWTTNAQWAQPNSFCTANLQCLSPGQLVPSMHFTSPKQSGCSMPMVWIALFQHTLYLYS